MNKKEFRSNAKGSPTRKKKTNKNKIQKKKKKKNCALRHSDLLVQVFFSTLILSSIFDLHIKSQSK